jgi:hypothetical protein
MFFKVFLSSVETKKAADRLPFWVEFAGTRLAV